MTSKLKTTFLLATLCAAMILVAISWVTYFENKTLKRQIIEIERAAENPYAINGFRPDILEQTTLLMASPLPNTNASLESRRVLVLVSSDLCPHCAATLPQWQQLIATTQWRANDEVWIVSYDAGKLMSPLVSQLKETHNVAFRFLAVKERLAFHLRTGIVATPATLVLDDKSFIRLCCIGTMKQREIDVFHTVLNERSAITSSNTKVFLNPPDSRVCMISRVQ